MRLLAATTFLLLLAATPASAAIDDDLDFGETYYVRADLGDIARTAATEPADRWNIVEYVRFSHANLTVFNVGDAAGSVACTCDGYTVDAGRVTISTDTPAGEYVLSVAHSTGLDPAFTLPLMLYREGYATDAALNVYVPAGGTASGPGTASALVSTDGSRTIHTFKGTDVTPLPAELDIAIYPATTVETPVDETGIDWIAIAIGLVAGALLWSILVSRGIVQARSRKQVASKAAHQTVAKAEGKSVLAARKRVLMAALKELEMGKMKQEIDTETYDALKAEYKKATVVVMRAIEESG